MAIEVTEIWPADPVAAACAKVKRSLTREEWRQYVGGEDYRPTCPQAGKAAERRTLPLSRGRRSLRSRRG
jgi:hypothetical protein